MKDKAKTEMEYRICGSFALGQTELCLPKVLDMAAAYAQQLTDSLNVKSSLVIHGGDGDRLDLIIRTLGCLLAGVQPILDEKRLLKHPERQLEKKDHAPAPALHIAKEKRLVFSAARTARLLAKLDALHDSATPALSFASSGSTGDPKLIDKHWRALCAEAGALAAFYGIRAGDRIVTLVSPFHIYGFLHTLMLSLLTGAHVLFVADPSLLLSESCGIQGRMDLLIAVPPLWPLVKILAARFGIGTLVTSGASFGPSRTADFMESGCAIAHAYEILGSTETGGVGIRDLAAKSAENPFTHFAGHSLVPSGQKPGRFNLHSRFLYPRHSHELEDELLLLDDGRFHHLGRTDRVFKYAGKRYALAEVERTLADLLGHENLCCLFRQRADHSKGGELLAVVENTGPWDETKLRRDYLNKAKVPPVERFIVVSLLPRDGNGKVERAALQALVN